MADAILPRAGSRPPLYVLMAEDGRFATYDTRTGPYLTLAPALAYSWRTQEEAEAKAKVYARVLGVAFHVEPTGGGA